MKTIKGFIIGVCSALFITILFTSVLGAEKLISIDVLYNNIKILLYGQELDIKDVNGNNVEPFIYNGTTYVPIRAVSEAFGKSVTWNADTGSVEIRDKNIEQKKDSISFETQPDGKIVITSNPDDFKEVTTDEVWDKMKMQIFYVHDNRTEEYLVYKDGEFKRLPGNYIYDGGFAQFVVSDLDNDGEYELFSKFHAGSGMDYQLLDCYIPDKNAVCNFGTVNCGYNIVKEDEQNIFLEFSTGERAKVNLVNENDVYNIVVTLPSGLSELIEKTTIGAKRESPQ
jgi:hypothetical protein